MQKFNNSKKEIKLITFNELSWESGYDYLLAAFSRTIYQHKLTLTIAGFGPLYGVIKYIIEDLEITKHVHVVNRLLAKKEISSLITKSDIYINFCVKYKQNLADSLALSSNKPIICSSVNELLMNKSDKRIRKILVRDIGMLSNNLISLIKTFNN